MNPAARLVILAFIGLAYMTVLAFCFVAVGARDLSALEKIAFLIVGYLAGVLTRTGYEAAKEALPLTQDASGQPAVNTVETSKAETPQAETPKTR